MTEYVKKENIINIIDNSSDLQEVKSCMMYGLETADVIERSTMEILCNEYLSKCNCCDECCAETYCILNSLRTENRDCVNNLITYFTKRNIGE